MSYRNGQPSLIDRLESRRLMAAGVTGYLPDYHYGVASKLDWSTLTTVNYFSVIPNGDTGAMPGTGLEPANSSGDSDLSQLTSFVALAHSHGVKVNIVVGGAGLDQSLTQIIDNPAIHGDFAASVQAFADKYHVDGVDLDWELYTPTTSQISGYADLIHTLRTNTDGLNLSAAVYPEGVEATDVDYQPLQLTPGAIQDLDQVNIMDYDLDYANHAPIARSENDMANWAYYTSNSRQPKTKLMMGLPFYGRAGTSWNNTTELSYADIISGYKSAHGGALPTDNNADTDFATVGGKTYYYNGPSTIQAKTEYARTNGYGGVLVWDLGHDIYTGNAPDTTLSLMSAIKRGLGGAPVATTGSISGKVQNSAGTGIAGVVVYVDTNNNGVLDASEIRITSDQFGKFTLDGIAPGSDRVVRQVPRGDLIQIKPTNNYGIHVAVTAAQTTTGIAFTDALRQSTPVGTVSGTVTTSAGGMAGVRVFYDANSNGAFDTGEVNTTTISTGAYTLANVPAGSGRVIRQVVPAGYYGSPASISVTVTANATASGKNFSNTPIRQTSTATIKGTVFNDLNANGAQNGGEAGFNGWRVFIDADNDGKFDTNELSALTNATGVFSLTGIATAGTYKVRVVKASGYVQTAPANNYGRDVKVTAGQTVSGVLFGAKK